MNIYSTIQIGDYHINHCEDFLITKNIGNEKILCAVMDGCSTAMDSHFASTLVGKILRKVAIETGYKELYESNSHFSDIGAELKSIVKDIFNELILLKNQLMLDEKELLTTLTILLYNKKENSGVLLVVGDGLICINGEITEFERDNKPDYLAYHLNKDFETWYSNQHQKIFFSDLKDISIATDGILTFSKIKKVDHEEEINVIDYLLKDNSNCNSEEMLNMKLKKLEHHYGLKPTDDLAIIRIIKD